VKDKSGMLMIHIKPREDKNNVITVNFTDKLQVFTHRINRYYLVDNMPAKMRGGTWDVPDPMAENQSYNNYAVKERLVKALHLMDKHIIEVSS
jgi:hypothetical protein